MPKFNTVAILNSRLEICKKKHLSMFSANNSVAAEYIIVSYFESSFRTILPLRVSKIVKQLIDSKDKDNLIIAAEILVKYDITNKR